MISGVLLLMSLGAMVFGATYYGVKEAVKVLEEQLLNEENDEKEE